MSYTPYLNQNYEEIKANSLKYGSLFEDDEFPACNGSLYRFKSFGKRIFWMRPYEITDNPQFMIDGINPNDFAMGRLNNDFLIKACSAVSLVPEYIKIVVPENQSFDEANYAGVFHFRIWHYGEWIDIVVDDFLPVNEDGKLIFSQNRKFPNEMFGPLLEKAFAKLNSCYEFLQGGNPIDAMIDMTGGVSESLRVKGPENDNQQKMENDTLWEILYRSFLVKSLCLTEIEIKDNVSRSTLDIRGLLLGTPYSVVGAYEIYSFTKFGSQRLIDYEGMRTSVDDKKKTEKPPINMLKLRCPTGVQNQWSGTWCYKSDKWRTLSDNLIQTINPYNEKDLEENFFFMAYGDFMEIFDVLHFLHLDMNALYRADYLTNGTGYKWLYQEFFGQWIPGINSGGSGAGNYYDQEAYWLNPQYLLNLSLKNSQDDKISMIVSLMQTEQVRKRSESDGTYLNANEGISFSIFCINDKNVNVKLLNSQKFTDYELKKVGTSGPYLQQREVTRRFEFVPGTYVIIPSLLKKNKRMKFILRVYIEGGLQEEDKQKKNATTTIYKLNKKEEKLKIKEIKELNKLKENENKLINGINENKEDVVNENNDNMNVEKTVQKSGVCIII